MIPQLARIRVYPIKSLDPLELAEVRIPSGVSLAGDREWALLDRQARHLNTKRLGAAVASMRAEYSHGASRVRLRAGSESAEFDLGRDTGPMRRWFARVLDRDVVLARDSTAGFPDDRAASGPTLVSTASLEAVAGRFGLALEEVRRRFRTNLEVAGVEAFAEDLLFGPPGKPHRFRIGDVELLGTNPCRRCVVPTLDSRTGVADGRLTARSFAEFRARHSHPGSDLAPFPGGYRFAVNTRVVPGQSGKCLRIGDALVPRS